MTQPYTISKEVYPTKEIRAPQKGKAQNKKIGHGQICRSPKAKRPTSLLPIPTVQLITSTMASATIATNSTLTPSSCRTCKRWGPPCPFCVQSALHTPSIDSNWSEETHAPKQEDVPTLVYNLVPPAKEEDRKEDKGEEQDENKDKEKEYKNRTQIEFEEEDNDDNLDYAHYV